VKTTPEAGAMLNSAQLAAAEIVHVPVPEFASKNTASEVVGTDAPVVPPLVADQYEVLAQLPPEVPPTQ
jgi:hypothetical protein